MAMDSDTVKEINDNIYDLNRVVRETNKALVDILGPMASQIKSKFAKNSTDAVTDQDKVTDEINTSTSAAKVLANKQNAMYAAALRRRGYEIDQTGKEVKTSIELTIQQKEMLDTLDKKIAKEKQLAYAIDKPVEAYRQMTGSVDSLNGLLDKLQDRMYEATGKSVGAAATLQIGIAAIEGAAKSFTVMADAIWKGERGAKVGAKGAKEFSDSITKAAYGIGAALMMLPLGPVLKIVGAGIALLAAAAEGATKLIEMGAELNDRLYDSYNKLSQKGLTTAKGMDGLYESLHKVGLTSAEIEKYNTLLGDNSKNLALFGGTAANGLAKYEKVASAIASPTSKLNKELLLLGVTSDAQREHIMKYMAEEDKLGLAKGQSDAQQIAGAKKYIENLDKLSMLTGANRKELEDARASVMANENLRAAIFDAEQDRSEAGQARLAELKRAYEAAAMLQASGDTRGAKGIAELAAGRGITSQDSAVAQQQFGGKGGLLEKIKKGGTEAEMMEAANNGYQRQADMMADTKRFGGDTSGLMTSGFGQTQEFGARYSKLKEEAAKNNMTVEEYIAKQQKDRKETTDEQTQKNAEVIQLQQQTGQILDNAAKKMDGAGLAMSSAMKLFNEGVEMFAGTTNKKFGSKTDQGAAGAADVSSESREIANVNADLDERQKDLLKQVQAEYKIAVANGTWLQKYYGVGLDEKMQAAKDKLKLAEQGKLEPAQLPPGATMPNMPGPPMPSGGGAAGQPSGPPTIAPGQAKPSESMSGNAARLSRELEKQGITNPIARRAIIMTAAKESGLNPQSKESGAAAYLKTLASRGLDYIWKVFPQLKPGGRVAVKTGYGETGVPASVLNSVWSKGDEAFFDYVYGGLSTNPFAGDGYKYRGRGLIGITGRTVYDKVGQQVGKNFVQDPDQVASDFDSAAAAAAGYMFMVRGGKQKALSDLNSMRDPNEALKYTLNTVAGLGHSAAAFDKEGSHLHEQLRKASQYGSLADTAVQGAESGAMFAGPKDGYFVQLHGKEFVGNQKHIEAIQQLIKTAKDNGLITSQSDLSESSSGFDDEETSELLSGFKELMNNKMVALYEKIKDGNRTDEELLSYSQG